jgi:hypothetical protein
MLRTFHLNLVSASRRLKVQIPTAFRLPAILPLFGTIGARFPGVGVLPLTAEVKTLAAPRPASR